MERGAKRVDGFRFLPPSLKAWIRSFIPEGDFTRRIPWTPLAQALRQTTLALVTSAGIRRGGTGRRALRGGGAGRHLDSTSRPTGSSPQRVTSTTRSLVRRKRSTNS